MIKIFGIAALLLTFVTAGVGQLPVQAQPQLSGDITGMYSFVHEGEFVQIEVSDDGRVTGLVSCFKGEDMEKAEFVDEFFEEAKLDGTTLSFRTKPAGGLGFAFSGTVERGSAKTPSEEGYWVVRGTATVRHTGPDGKTSEKTHELTLKSFPQDAEPNAKGGSDKK
jgi:hypothetical protein